MAAAQPRPADDPRRTRLSIPLPLEAALTYSLGTITGVLFLMLEKENDYVRFHAWQSCFLFLPLLLLHAILSFTLVGSIIILVIDILVIIAMGYKAHKDAATLDRFMLPLIGPLADRMNREENEH